MSGSSLGATSKNQATVLIEKVKDVLQLKRKLSLKLDMNQSELN